MQHCIMEHQILEICIMGLQHCILKHIMQACFVKHYKGVRVCHSITSQLETVGPHGPRTLSLNDLLHHVQVG